MKPLNVFILIFFSFALIFVTNSCSRNPVTGKKQLLFMSESQEISLGRQYDPTILATFGVYDDPKLQAFITQKGTEMAKVSHRPKLPYQFKVVDSPVVNAFAVPGGFVYFTRGIMAHFNNEAEFAGVLGHEIGHVTAKHGARQQTTQILSQIGLIAGIVLAPEFAEFAEIAQAGLGLLFLKYSRDHERESDKLGVEYSTKIGYDANYMAGFFNTLKRLGAKSEQSIPSFLSTHPDPGDRNIAVRAMTIKRQREQPGKTFKVNREEYLRLIDGLVYGEDPKQGFVESSIFYHPELKFQFPVPQGWQYENSPIQFQMAPRDGKALMALTLAKGSTLEQAAQNTIQQYKLRLIESRRTTINGHPAIEMLSEPAPQQQQQQQQQNTQNQIRVSTWLIQYNNLIYSFQGLTYAATFNQYFQEFARIAGGFSTLTDPDKLNRLPERVRIKTVPFTTTLRECLQEFNMPASRIEELSILNGLMPNETVSQGSLIKIVSK